MHIAVLGAGWAGLAAGLLAARQGHRVTLFEAARSLGGRARALEANLPDGRAVTLDNGQHLLIGAYTQTLALMRSLGIDPHSVLLRMPLTLRFPDGRGLRFPDWPAPWDAVGAIAGARGWTLADKYTLLRTAVLWRRRGFECPASASVDDICSRLTTRVRQELIDPLCVSALNTPPGRASAQVFLRVLRDAMFGVSGASRLLLPRVDLSALFPQVAATAIVRAGGQVLLGRRVERLVPNGVSEWLVEATPFDAVLLCTDATESARLLERSAHTAPTATAQMLHDWSATARGLRFESIATVYAWAPQAALAEPLLALRSGPGAPAQFAFDRGQLGGPDGLLAFVVSASHGSRETLQAQVLEQARQQLGLTLAPVQTVVERRATFACTPGLQRPAQRIAPGLLACADYVQGPYPATLEGAIRSAESALAPGLADPLAGRLGKR